MIRWFHDTLSCGMISLAMLGIMWIVKIVPGRVVRSYPDQWNWMNFCRQESSSKDAANSEEHQKRMA
ncbi:MAG: hypothetical protein QF619_04800 [Candidatus Binatia bacterium]|jgi:hypothetical protein|nr:hypothetical protein [Candidatus Binatia bacterium]|tara:strand:+ start:133 stop:333 length:201 start_codon:yes stop_codon:yes gene_type:complete